VSTGLWIALVAVVVALAFGAYRALTDGSFRSRGSSPRRSADQAQRAAGERSPAEEPAAAVDQAATPDGAAAPSDRSTWAELAAAVAAAGVEPGERATLVQFSSAFCAPCRVTRRVLSDVAETVPGVVHIDIDAEQHLDVVRRLDILRTPTTLVLDAAGNEVARAAGAPRKEQVLSAIPAVDPTL